MTWLWVTLDILRDNTNLKSNYFDFIANESKLKESFFSLSLSRHTPSRKTVENTVLKF